jgi:hypothetical protein
MNLKSSWGIDVAAPKVHLHRPEMMSVVFERGVYRSLKTGARIEYESRVHLDENNGFGGNFRGPLLLDRSIKLLMGAPYNFLPFTSLDRNGNAAPPIHREVFGNGEAVFSNLVLVNMSAKMVASNNIVDVEMSYEHILDGFNQILIDPPSRRLFVKGKASIVDKTTKFFRKDGNPAAPKVQLAVAHTYPETDTEILATPFSDALPLTVVQTGEVNVPFPAKGFTLQGIIYTDDILKIGRDLVGRMNEETLMGETPINGAGHWLCSDMTYEMHNASHTLWQRNRSAYKVSLEFQYNYDTWNPTVMFHDKRTGMPPADLRKGDMEFGDGVLRWNGNRHTGQIQPAGYWTVPYLPRQNFTNYFGPSAGGVLWEAVG